MNTYEAKKIGEIAAFADIGAELYVRGESALRAGMGDDEYTQATQHFAEKKLQYSSIDLGENITTMHEKQERTVLKLRNLMETYIGDQWDNVVELYEWMGFFLGAGWVHGALVEGMAEGTGNTELGEFAKQDVAFYRASLQYVEQALRKNGKEKVSA